MDWRVTDSFCQHNAAYRNRPFLVGPALTENWPCIKKWRQSLNGDDKTPPRPKLSALQEYAHHTVQVADCSTRRYNEFDRTERRLGEVLDLWKEEDENSRKLYVKDWHQALLLEQDGGRQDQIYMTPDIFKGTHRPCFRSNTCFKARLTPVIRRLDDPSRPHPRSTR
jgi:hypothetical protein